MVDIEYDIAPWLPRREGNTGILYTSPVDTANGSFVFPRTWLTKFQETSTVNISWSTNYARINLYCYQRGNVANSVQLATNLATNDFLWNVRSDEMNLTEPFVFRIVNARGTDEEQKGGGFWSTSFYITRDVTATATDASSSSNSLVSLSSTPSPSAISPSAISPSAISPSAISPSAIAPSWIIPTTSVVVSSTVTSFTTSPYVPTILPTPVEHTESSVSSSAGPSTAAVIGIAMGAALGVLGLVAGVWYAARRRNRKSTPPQLPEMMRSAPPPYWAQQAQARELYCKPPELPATRIVYELAHEERRP